MMTEKLKNFWPQVFLLLAILFFLREILFQGKIFFPPGQGLGDYIPGTVSFIHYLSSSLKDGRLPLWLPEIFAGFPLAANGESGLFYPLNLILTLLFPPNTALSLYVFFTFLIMGFSTFYFIRSLGLSKEASLVSSLSFTFAGGLIARFIHFPILGTVAYLPLTLLLAQKFFEKRNPLILIFLSFILSFQILNFNPQTTLICFIGFIFYFLFKIYESLKSRKIFLDFLALALVLFLSFSLSAVQLVPGLEIFLLSGRKAGVTEAQAGDFPFHPGELTYFLGPTPIGDPSLGNYNSPYPDPGIFWENNTYIGLVGLIFGILAILFLSHSQKLVLVFGLLFLFSLLLALGKSTPFFFILRLPPFSFFRLPGRFLILSMFSLSVLAGFGFEGLTQRFASRRSLLGLLASLLILFDLFSFGLFYNPTLEARRLSSPPESAQFLSEDKSFFRIYSVGDYEAYYTLYRQFRGWRKNIEPYFNLREALPPNINLIYGLNHAEGNLGLPPKRFTDWMYLLPENIKTDEKEGTAEFDPLSLKMLRLKNVKYVLSYLKIKNSDFKLRQEVNFATGQPGLYIYELKDPLPHVFLVHKAKVLKEGSLVLEEFKKESFDPQKEVLLEEPFENLDGNPSLVSETEIIKYFPEEVIIKAKTEAPAFLVLTDTNFPGWQAKVDGKTTKIYQANYLFRAVRLNEGEHQIEFTYRPKLLYVGAAISISTFLVTLILTLFFLIKTFLIKTSRPR